MSLTTTSQPAQASTPNIITAQTPAVAARSEINAKATWLAPAIALLVVAIVSILTLTNYPATFVDEGSNSNRAWSLLQTGRAFASMDYESYRQYDGYWTYFPYLGTLAHSAFIWTFGLSLASLRLASVFFGLILLLVVYIIASRSHGPRAGLIAMALLAISAPFVLSSHLGRHDIIVAALGFSAIALYVTDSGSSLSWRSVLSGLALGLAIDIHYNVIVFGPVILGLYLLDYGWNAFRTGRFWGFVAGGLLGVLFFAAMHIVPYPQTYFAIGSLGNGTTRTPPIFSIDPSLWQWSFTNTIAILDLLLLPLMIPAAFLLIRRQSRADMKVGAIFGILLITVAAFIKFKGPYYGILLAPAVALLVAPYIQEITQRIGSIRQWAFWRNALVISAVVMIAFINWAPAAQGSDDEFNEVLTLVRQTIPAGSLVYGTPSYWLAAPNTPYVNWEQIIFRQRQTPGYTFTDAVETLKPDYLILDSYVKLFTYDDEYCNANNRNVACVPSDELATLLKEKATLIGDMKTNNFGDVQIYKMELGNKGQGGGQK